MSEEDLIEGCQGLKDDGLEWDRISVKAIDRLVDLIRLEQSVQSMLKKALGLVLDLTDFETGSVHLLGGRPRRLRLSALQSVSQGSHPGLGAIGIPEGILRKVMRKRKPLLIKSSTEFQDLPGLTTRKEKTRYLLSFPLAIDGRVFGTLSVVTSRKEKLTQGRVQLLLALIPPISVALGSVDLFHRISEAKKAWENAVDTLSDLIFICDDQFQVIRVNKSLLDRYGHALENVIGRSCDEIFYNERTFPVSLYGYKSMVTSGISFVDEVVSPNYNGVFTICVYPQLSSDQRLLGSIHVIQEVTKNRQWCREKHDLQDRMTHLADGFIELTEDGTIRTWDQGVVDLLGYAEEEARGKPLACTAMAPESKGAYEIALAQVKTNGGAQEIEALGLTKDGRKIPLSITLWARRDHAGRILGIKGVIRDMTAEEEATSREIEAAKDLAVEALAKKIPEFFDGVFGRILLQLGSESLDSGEAGEDFKRTEGAVLKAMAILEKLKRFAVEAAVEGLPSLNTQLLFKQLIVLTRRRWGDAIREKGIDLEVSEDQRKLPPIRGNEDELKEACLNIIANAIESMASGGKLILRSRTDREWVTLAVTDTGIGMTKEERGRAFDPFYSTQAPDREGLGLSLSRWIVRRHNGQIFLQSEKGHGTTVTIKLPVLTQPK